MRNQDRAKLLLIAHELRVDAQCAADCDHPYEHLDKAADGIESLVKENRELELIIGPHDVNAEDLIKQLVDNAQAIQENSDSKEDEFAIVLLAAASRIRRQEARIAQLEGRP